MIIVQLYLWFAALQIVGFNLLLMKEYKPNMFKTIIIMFKTIIIAAMIMFTVGVAPSATADTSQNCAYLNANPSVSDAEDLMVFTALEAYDNGDNMDAVGRRFATDIINNCPQHLNTVLEAAENISSNPSYN